jgi:hypothetical protein
MEYCLADAKGRGKSGVCMLEAKKQNSWLTNDVPVSFLQVNTLQKAKELPCVFNNWAVFYKGKFETANLPDSAYLERIPKK